MTDFLALKTESGNPDTANLDKMTAYEIAKVINDQDKTVAFAVEKALPEISQGIETLGKVLKAGGRIFYIGAGTSGRLGVLDASECPPTFGVSPETVQGIIAGGPQAAFYAVEDAEDDYDDIKNQLIDKGFDKGDALVALSASGTANCVKGAIAYATELGAPTLCVSCNKNSELVSLCETAIIAEVGAEVISGSTRMKAGSAQKMIINMLSTGAMVLFGRVRGNHMAYMIPTNKKLVDRAIRIIMAKTGVDFETAKAALEQADNQIALAIDNIESKN